MTNPWQSYINTRIRRIELEELDESLKGLWIDVLPTVAHSSDVFQRLRSLQQTAGEEGGPSEDEAMLEMMKIWIKGWNLPDGKGNPLPQIDDDKEASWVEVVPFQVQLFLLQRLNELDDELTEMSPNTETPSSPS